MGDVSTETELDLDYLRSELGHLMRAAYEYGELQRSDCNWLFNAITDLLHEVERLTA